MHLVSAAVLEKWNALSDAQIAAEVVTGRTALFEVLMRRHNERVYRTVRAVVRDDGKAEQLLQQAFVNAYANLSQFDPTTPFAIWLTRIAVKAAASLQVTESTVGQATAGATHAILLKENAHGKSRKATGTSDPPDAHRVSVGSVGHGRNLRPSRHQPR